MKKELLVIDDELALCQMLSEFFSERGFRVHTAMTIQDGIAQLAKHRPDVLLLDLKLPDGSGLDILSSLKTRFPSLRVVVISGQSDSPTVQAALQRGASDYILKPFDFTRCFYAAMGMAVVELTTAQPQREALARVPAAVAQQYKVLPMRWSEATGLELAMADPFDVQRLDELKTLLKCEITPLGVLNPDEELLGAIHRWYGMGAAEVAARQEPSRTTVAEPESAAHSGRSGDDATGIIGLVNNLIQHALNSRATDLHVGMGPDGPWIRERVDGILYGVPVAAQFGELYTSVVSRLKVMANLDIAEHRIPHDGRIWFDVGKSKLDLRISVLPTVHGENLAIRLLEPSKLFHIEQLGLSDEQRRALTHVLAKPTGLLLVTGPTGSGKSTSLYAFLSKLNTGKVNIVTIEDPVEHEQRGLTQIQVQPKVGLTFAAGLRSMLRHDPDIIMVGEIRDQETANLAVRAALTGHLVLSTLHTNDAASGVTRLMDLGIEPFLLCSTLNGILSQRLVRRLCQACRESVEVDLATLSHVGLPTAQPMTGTVKVWRARGCTKCRDTGYLGRTGVFEMLTVDHRIRSLIIKRTSSTQIRQSAIAAGMQTLTQSSWEKVLAGLTSLEELVRFIPSDPH